MRTDSKKPGGKILCLVLFFLLFFFSPVFAQEKPLLRLLYIANTGGTLHPCPS